MEPILTFLLYCGLFQKPSKDSWGSGLEAMEDALQLEKDVNQSLLDKHKVANQHGDAQVNLDFTQNIIQVFTGMTFLT